MAKMNHRLRNMLLIAGVLVLGASAYIVWTGAQPHYDNIAATREAAGLQIVLPNPLPSDATVTNQPAYDKITGNILTRIQVHGTAITFSQQKRPKTDLKQVDAADTFLVNAGSVYILKGEEGRLQAIVETPDSWLMVNADVKLGVKLFREVLESLDAI